MKSRKVKAANRSKAYLKKCTNTIPIETEDQFDENQNEDSSSDEEALGQIGESSSEEEVLPITDDESDSSDEVEDEEQNSTEEDDDLPNLDNWGRKKSTYYNADFVDKDRGKTYRDEDLEMENAEREAAQLQQLTSVELDKFESCAYFEDYDRRIDLISMKHEDESYDAELEDDDNPEIEKLKHEKRKHPKFLEYKESFIEKSKEVNKLAIILELVEKVELDENFTRYVKFKYQVLLHYMLNVSFYFYLKNAESFSENHPIYERIEQFKELDDKLNTQKNYLKEIDVILKRIAENKEMFPKSSNKVIDVPNLKKKMANSTVTTTDIVSKKKNKSKQFETEDEKEILAMYSDMKNQQRKIEPVEIDNVEEEMSSNIEFEENTGEKRTITYQIAKNKGLVPRRKKECRNPRVHHRMKFRKAKIRRKGQVREVIKEIKRYAGEPTGISAHVVKSIKLK